MAASSSGLEAAPGLPGFMEGFGFRPGFMEGIGFRVLGYGVLGICFLFREGFLHWSVLALALSSGVCGILTSSLTRKPFNLRSRQIGPQSRIPESRAETKFTVLFPKPYTLNSEP